MSTVALRASGGPPASIEAVLAGWAAGQPVRWLFQNKADRFTNAPVGAGFGWA